MPLTTLTVGAAVTPTVLKTYVTHYTNRKPLRERPTAHISYDQGLHLVRSFLNYASHHAVEELQAFTSQWVPAPTWVRIEDVSIPASYLEQAAELICENLGDTGVQQIGGRKWWQWRPKGSDLRAEWVEMKSDYHARKQTRVRSNRIMMYIHGGAYFFGSVDEHRYQIQRHARKLKARVLAPRYRLAPQFPFPCALQDCLATYLHLLSVHDASEIILAGDSAGGGIVISMMCILRDQRRPLPAGAVLISPWVDLTHSFPSVTNGSDLDYIPAHGFMQKPSASWPPPNDDEIRAITQAITSQLRGSIDKGKLMRKDRASVDGSAADGFAEVSINQEEQKLQPEKSHDSTNHDTSTSRNSTAVPVPGEQLTIEVDGKLVLIKDQVQMYTTNQLISHPLVSPVLQPSLGGLPPLLIMAGGGEVLRDEQIYLAHKAAHPEKYPLGKVYRARYDPDDDILKKYEPTYVQLQVWEDLCHVAPTLSFTRPAKFMYRSVAQFGAWALARAQGAAVEIVDDDAISVISSSSSDADEQTSHEKPVQSQPSGSIGRAGDILPSFKNHMIRQRIDQSGNVYHLESHGHWAALQMAPDDIGVVKSGPVRKWMEAKSQWDKRYASTKTKVHKQRVKDMLRADSLSFGPGEKPPPSALAGRTSAKRQEDKQKKSLGLAMWSMWGSKHDEATLKREEEVIEVERRASMAPSAGGLEFNGRTSSLGFRRKSGAGLDGSAVEQKNEDVSPNRKRKQSMGRRRTIVVDEGQAGGFPLLKASRSNQEGSDRDPGISLYVQTSEDAASGGTSQDKSQDPTHLSPVYQPKFKTHFQELSGKAQDQSDVTSTMTGHSQITPDDASTRAVFGAAGVIYGGAEDDRRDYSGEASILQRNFTDTTKDDNDNTYDSDMPSEIASTTPRQVGNETPASRRSLERLQSHQNGTDKGETALDGRPTVPETSQVVMKRLETLRSTSTTAVIGAPGVVGIVPGGNVDRADREVSSGNSNLLAIPGLESTRSRLTSASSTAVVDAPGVISVIPGAVADFERQGVESPEGDSEVRNSAATTIQAPGPATIGSQQSPNDDCAIQDTTTGPISIDQTTSAIRNDNGGELTNASEKASGREAGSLSVSTSQTPSVPTTINNKPISSTVPPAITEAKKPERPGMYGRQDSDFLTAMEKL